MIRAIRSNDPRFKNVQFSPGFNVILADRVQESTEKDSRNGLGKTMLIEIIHFCLGATARKNSGLLREELLGWEFSLEFDVGGQEIVVTRSTRKPRRVFLKANWSDWPIKPRVDTETNETSMSVREWNELLGWLAFGLAVSDKQEKYVPSFRSLISFFVRKGRDAFTIPFEHHRKQAEWDRQVNNAFLLGLDWTYAQKLQIIKDEEKALGGLLRAAKTGLMPQLLGKIGELEPAKVRLEEQVAREREQLRTFKVHPQYDSIQQTANDLTRAIHDLTQENVIDTGFVALYQKSIQSEQPVDRSHLASVYEEARVFFSQQVSKRLEEVEEFHRQIISSRREFLQDEINRLQREATKRQRQIEEISNERAALLSILESHGALEEYNSLQGRYLQKVAELEAVQLRIDSLRKFEQGRSQLRIEKESLLIQARTEGEAGRSVREKAISFFNANSEDLYQAPGVLIIEVTENGYAFDVNIERSSSQGIEQMKVFCYDLMLSQVWSPKEIGPRFLVHDSTIFDGVDERQFAHALELAARESQARGFQYICCLNSDTIPWHDFHPEFDLNRHVCLRLTDARDDGALLGFRF